MQRLTNIILIGFPLFLVSGVTAQVIGERIARANAVEAALEACYDAPDTTDEECEAFADAGSIHPSAQ